MLCILLTIQSQHQHTESLEKQRTAGILQIIFDRCITKVGVHKLFIYLLRLTQRTRQKSISYTIVQGQMAEQITDKLKMIRKEVVVEHLQALYGHITRGTG